MYMIYDLIYVLYTPYILRLIRLLDYFDSEWEISRKEVFNAEFGAFVHLGFSLHVPHQHVYLVSLWLCIC